MPHTFDRLRALLSSLTHLLHVRPLASAEQRERDMKLKRDRQIDKAWDGIPYLRQQLLEMKNRLDRERTDSITRMHQLHEQAERDAAQIQQLEDERALQYLETRALQQQLSDMNEHLKQLTRESDEAREWMGIRDRFPDAHVVAEIKAVNYEIQNIATPLADALVDAMEAAGLSLRLARETFAHIPFSSRAVEVIAGESMSGDALPTLLGIVIQSALVSFACNAIMQWDSGFGGEADDVRTWFSSVFESIYQSEPVAISGNYRALTHRHARRIAAQTYGAPRDVLANIISFRLLAIAFGCGLDEDTAKKIIKDSVDDAIMSSLLAVIQNLNLMIYEDIISGWLIPVVVEPDTFLETAFMRVGLGEESEEDLTVMATIGLGLERRERREDGNIAITMLLRPEVATDAVLDSL